MKFKHPLKNAIDLIEGGNRYEVNHGIIDTRRNGMPVNLDALGCITLDQASRQCKISSIETVSLGNLERRTAGDLNNDPYL